jgi:hypothetical protein
MLFAVSGGKQYREAADKGALMGTDPILAGAAAVSETPVLLKVDVPVLLLDLVHVHVAVLMGAHKAAITTRIRDEHRGC